MQVSKSNTVKHPQQTAEQKARLDAVAAMPDERIAYTDAPHLPDGAWMKVAELPGVKQQVTLRLDADVLSEIRRFEALQG